RQEGAPRMVDTDKACVRDDVERLFAAVVGVRAPADVGQQTGGVAQPPLFARLIQSRGTHEAIRPFDQLFAVGGRARAQAVQVARRSEQRVLLAVVGVEE